MKKINIKSNHSGMTLIELMVATVILVIITSASFPSMKLFFERKNIFAIGDHFVKTIKLARIEAVQRGKTIRVFPTAPDSGGFSDWSQGWRMEYTNSDDLDNIFIQVIRTFPAISGSPNFSSDDYNSNTPLSIAPTGQATPLGEFSLRYPDCSGKKNLTFEVLTSGLIKRGVTQCP